MIDWHMGRWLAVAACAALLAHAGCGAGRIHGHGGGIRAEVPPWQTTRREPRQRTIGEPAFARGYSDGWDRGLGDGRDRRRYDPVRHGDYRSADDGYTREYGSKDAYRNNYRAGFRQGYEDGYRDGARRRR